MPVHYSILFTHYLPILPSTLTITSQIIGKTMPLQFKHPWGHHTGMSKCLLREGTRKWRNEGMNESVYWRGSILPLESPWVQKAESCRQRRVNGSVSPTDACILNGLLRAVQFNAFPINEKTCRHQWTFNGAIGIGPLISRLNSACDMRSSGTCLPRCWFTSFVKSYFGMTASQLLLPQLPSAKVTCSNLSSISPLSASCSCHFSPTPSGLFWSSLDRCVLSLAEAGPGSLWG